MIPMPYRIYAKLFFLAVESIAGTREKGLDASIGDFAKNITTAGIGSMRTPIGIRVKLRVFGPGLDNTKRPCMKE